MRKSHEDIQHLAVSEQKSGIFNLFNSSGNDLAFTEGASPSQSFIPEKTTQQGPDHSGSFFLH